MRKHITIVLTCLALLFVAWKLSATTAAYTTTIQIVDSLGNILGGTASAVTAQPAITARVVDSNNKVLDSLGTGGPLVSGLYYFGRGTEGAKSITSGTSTVAGYHEYSSLTISGTGQLLVGAVPSGPGPANQDWTVIRVSGTCNIASTATCVKADGTNDTACAVDASGDNANSLSGVSDQPIMLGGTSGGTGWDAASGGVNTVDGISGYNLDNEVVLGGAKAVNNSSNGSPGIAATAKAANESLAVLTDPMFTLTAVSAAMTGNTQFGGMWGSKTSPASLVTQGGGMVFVLLCHDFGTTTGHIIADGAKGADGVGGCGTNNMGDGGSGGGYLLVAGPGGYPAANMSVAGGIGGLGCAAGSTNGGAGGKGAGFSCNTTTGVCTAL